MEFILETINTIIYFGCVKSIGELFLNYKSKRLKYENIFYIIIGIVVAEIMLYSNFEVDILIHVTSILLITYTSFQESIKKWWLYT